MADWVTNAVNTLKASQQQLVWKEFTRHVRLDMLTEMQKDGVLNLNSLSFDSSDRFTRSILMETGMNRLRLVVEINDYASCNCVLFLRSFLLSPRSRAVSVGVP